MGLLGDGLPKKKMSYSEEPQTIQEMQYKGKVLQQTKQNIRKNDFRNIMEKGRKAMTGFSKWATQQRYGKYNPQTRQYGIPLSTRRREQAVKKSIRMVFPVIPASAIPSATAYQGKTGKQGRGRPKGTTKYPGGIYQWRKLQRAAKAQAKYQTLLRQSQAMQQYPRMQAARAVQLQQQQMQQQPQQVPQAQVPQQRLLETQGYQQQMPQEQYQEYNYPQQYPQAQPQPQQREIVPVFKSSGGHPYPPVNNQPLQLAKQTVPQGYIETVDLMTGRRYFKQLPQAEAWVRGRNSS